MVNVQKLGDKPDSDALIGLTKTVLDLHRNGEVDQVYLCGKLCKHNDTRAKS